MRRIRASNWWATVPLAVALSLLLVSGASAAKPKPGQLYTGSTAASYNNFTAPVSFTTSRTAKQLLRFKWAGGGCLGLGGPGNAWASPQNNYKVGTINVSGSGSFSVKNVKVTFRGKQGGQTFSKVTISTVKGRFTNTNTATGTIYYTQSLNGSKPCSGRISFTAILGPFPGPLHKTVPANGTTVKSSGPTLTWTSSRNATRYQYCLDKSSNDACNARWISTGKITNATLKVLTAGATYYWQVKASSVHGTVAADSARWYAFTVPGSAIKPRAGSWRAITLSGPVSGNGAGGSIKVTSLFFGVAADQSTVSSFGFGYDYLGVGKPPTYSCSGSGVSAESAPSLISRGQFSTPGTTGAWTGAGSATFNGTFDSPTSAHGTATASVFVSGFSCALSGTSSTGTFSWTAAWHS
jgi:hypothetical protein